MKKEDLQKILDDLAYGDKYGEVLRAKGMVPSEEKGLLNLQCSRIISRPKEKHF